ncbi:MAG TPA: zinc ribbon domain-containing protein [Phototrophicaceae bacterium]|nr:zinc ribbon domain-containing protein [Phototrophicaceae bacterium]
MTDTPPPDRKLCAHCGHANRGAAKVCSQCGQPFLLVGETGTLRKTCPGCGHKNRVSAQVCSQCGRAFRSGTSVKVAATNRRPRWCPQCGTARRPSAKVCPQCGHKFYARSSQPPLTQTPPPAVTLLPDVFPAPPVDLPPTLTGEPSPFLSSDELDRLRQTGMYHPNILVRLYHRTRK